MPRTKHPIELAKDTLVERLSGIIVLPLPTYPGGRDYATYRNDLMLIAGWVDQYIEALGDHAGENIRGLDRSQFKNQLTNALEGNATYELDCAIEQLRENV